MESFFPPPSKAIKDVQYNLTYNLKSKHARLLDHRGVTERKGLDREVNCGLDTANGFMVPAS